MNPRILEGDLDFYQKEPDMISPNIPSLSRKSLDGFEPSKSTIKPSTICLDPSSKHFSTDKSLGLNDPNKIRSLTNSHFMNFPKPKITNARSVENLLRIGGKSPMKRSITKKPETEKPKKKTLFEVLSNFYLAKKFINTLKNITSRRTPKFLSKKLFSVINDLSFFYDVWKQKEMQSRENFTEDIVKINRQNTHIFEIIQKKSRQFWENFGTFDNSSTFMIFWNVIHLALILYFFCTIPLEACFDVRLYEEYHFIYYMQNLACYFFVGDILVNCNTAVYLKGKLIKDRLKIIQNYLKTYCFKDILSIVSIFLQLNKTDHLAESFLIMNMFRILFFLRMINFSAIIKKLEEMFFIDQSVHNILSLVKLIFRIILLSHIFACLWFYIATLSPNSSWISHNNLQSEPWWTRYLNSYYYVAVTMNTVGYGDITPQNSYEKVFAIIFIYIACGIFAYSLNSIGVIVSEIARRENEFQKDLNIINEFMKQKKINFDLRMRVRKYLEYIWYEEKIEKIEEQTQIFDKLSDSLREELLLEANGAILRDLKMFSFNFSEDLLRNTVPLLKEVRFTPEDLIFMKGKCDQKALYIIRKGKVEIFLETNKMNSPITVLKTLHEGQIFGEFSFFSNQERSACARSMDFTTAYMIKNEEFLSLLRKYPKDYQKFCEIRDNINLYGDFKDLYTRCYSCNEVTHLISDCPNINYKPIRDILLHRYFISVSQVRCTLSTTRKIKSFNAVSNQNLIERKSFAIQATLFPAHESQETSNNISEYSQKVLSKYSLENSSFEEPISEDEKEDDPSQELLKTKKETNKETGGMVNESSAPTFKESFENCDEIKPADQMIQIQRKNTKGKYFITENKDRKSRCQRITAILEGIEGEIYNTLLMESSASLNSFNNIDKEHSNNTVKTHGVGKLRSLLTFINDLKEGRETKKKLEEDPKLNLNVIATTTENHIELLTDCIKSWDFYFPHNNCEKIIENFNLFLNRRNRKNHSTKSSSPDRTKNLQIVTSRRHGFIDKSFKNLENFISPHLKLNGSSLFKKKFFQSNNVIEKFMKETQFDPEKIKSQYRRLYEKNRIKEFFNKIIKRFFWRRRSDTKKEIKSKRQWKENTYKIKTKNDPNKV